MTGASDALRRKPSTSSKTESGNHMPDARDQFAADDRRPHAYLIGWRGYFGFLPDPRVLTNLEAWIRRRLRCISGGNGGTGTTDYGASPPRHREFAASVAAGSPTGLWRMSDTRRFNTPYEIMCSTLLVSPNLHACAGLTRSNRRGTDRMPGGVGGWRRETPPIPIFGTNGHAVAEAECPLLREKRTRAGRCSTSARDEAV